MNTAATPLRRIDPVIGVEESGPGETAGAAAVRPRLHVRERGIGRLQSFGFYMADLVFSHECNRLQAQDADVVESAPLQQHSDEGQVIGGGRIEARAAR